MTKRALHRFFALSAVAATLLALSTRADLRERDDDDDRQEHQAFILPTGQFVTPTALEDAVQQFLNPNLPAYPNFVAGEAVRAQLSPDGTTLAIITAAQ